MLGSFTDMVSNYWMGILCSVLARHDSSVSACIGYIIITLVLGNAASQFMSACELYGVRYGRWSTSGSPVGAQVLEG